MICIILVAGHGTRLESEIKQDPRYSHLVGVPKALLPGVGGHRILDYWWEALKTRQLFNEVYLVTNADKYKHYERWATASEFPVENIINDGTTSYQNRLGAVVDVDLVLRSKKVDDEIMVVAGDMLFQDNKFDPAQVLRFFKYKEDGDLAIYYQMEPEEDVSSRGIVEVNPEDNRILHFYEKPSPGVTTSRQASVVFYLFRASSVHRIPEFLAEHPHIQGPNFGRFLEWLINTKEHRVYGLKLPTGFQLIGQVGLCDYERWLGYFADQQNSEGSKHPVTKRAYARVGLMGNPSDGFGGKTIALSVANFWAEVTIVESEKLVLVPHPLNDPTEYGSLADLYGISTKDGYLGGLRLLQATCMKFYQYCSKKGIALGKRNFTLKYDTNIPRQVGLAGSSAIVTATLQCLMYFYNLNENDMPKEIQPQFILDVEMQELFIQAGLQDRVIQIYEGLVYMDFSQGAFESQGHGNYVNLDVSIVPSFWLAYLADPSDSGKIHSDVSIRWKKGETAVVEGMRKFAELTDAAKEAIGSQDWPKLGDLMNQNFDLRRSIYGDDALGVPNLRMIEIARAYGGAAKFPGSGGAVVGLTLDLRKKDEMKKAFQAEGFVVCDLIPNPGGNKHNPPVGQC